MNRGAVYLHKTIYYVKLSQRPKRIILIRHAESTANIDINEINKVPYHKIPLSKHGEIQAVEAGLKLKKLIGNQSVKFFISPFERSKATYRLISKQMGNSEISVVEEPRIREQEWGNFKKTDKLEEIFKERREVGKFFYRFSTGESGADVYDRCSSFFETLFRDINSYDRHRADNIVLLCHGFFMRLFIMRYFHMTVEEFEKMEHPDNCEMWILELDKNYKYQLITKIKERHPNEQCEGTGKCNY